MIEKHLKIPILLSIAAAIFTLGLKSAAYVVTGSVGLLSDAAESLVNLLAALAAYLSLRYAARPVDRDHTYGHEKIEFFSSALEGVLILVAALTIAWFAIERLRTPQLPEQLGLGLGLSLVASVVNGVVATILLRAGRRHGSIVLEADGQHLMTDVYTSAGVLVGLGIVWATGVRVLDPLVALVVACNILWTAGQLLWRSFNGLMDHALPDDELAKVRAAIEGELGPNMAYHALRTRQAGAHRFVDFHLLVPGAMSVHDAHAVTGRVEAAVQSVLPRLEVTVHVEPIEDREAYEDSALVPLEEAARQERNDKN
jgi:cation diffusion facilitator family transporter